MERRLPLRAPTMFTAAQCRGWCGEKWMKTEEELPPTSISTATVEPHAADDVFLLPAVLHSLPVKVDGIERNDTEWLTFVSPHSSTKSKDNQDEISDWESKKTREHEPSTRLDCLLFSWGLQCVPIDSVMNVMTVPKIISLLRVLKWNATVC